MTAWIHMIPLEEASGKLAEMYELEILERSIQDIATNTTRFLVLSPSTCPPTGKDRTSLMFAVRDEPGSLHRALEPFEEFRINLSKIESRPSKQKAWTEGLAKILTKDGAEHWKIALTAHQAAEEKKAAEQFARLIETYAENYRQNFNQQMNPLVADIEGDPNVPGRSIEWWRWDPEANWRQPAGKGSSIEGKDDHPVVCVTHEDATAFAKWAGS